MLKDIKLLILSTLIFFTIIFITPYSITNQGLFPNHVSISNGIVETYTGDYEGDISVMYFDQNSQSSFWSYENSSTNLIPHNTSVSDYEFKLNRMEIWAHNLVNLTGIGNYTIANNLTNGISLTQAYGFAQEFTAHDYFRLENISFFLSYAALGIRWYDIFIFDENFEEQIDYFYISDSRLLVNEWVTISSWNPKGFEPNNKYNIVLKIWTSVDQYNNSFNYWKAESYPNSSLNKGTTRYYDGENWFVIPNDDTIDMLCSFSYTKLIDPVDIDLKFIIDDQEITPIYQESTWGLPGFEAYLSYIFHSTINQDVNVTIKTNQTIPMLEVLIDIYYIYLINATGTYEANESQIEWTIEYQYEEITFGWPLPIFLFEKDWSFKKFYDPDGTEISQIYFGPMNLFNKSYYGITVFFGPPLEEGVYTGIFQSPSYCHNVKIQVKKGDDFVIKPTVEVGQTIKLEAEIFDPFNSPITGGIGQIILISPSDITIYNETNLIPNNGSMISSEISIGSGFEEGVYDVIVFWTDGKEVALYRSEVIVKKPVDFTFMIILIVAIILACIPTAYISYRFIKQRNWEKSLKNLFVLTKDGLSLYEYSFGIEIQDPALISALISALDSFAREATGSEKALRTVDQEDKKVILYHGNSTTSVLIGEKDLPIIHKRIRKFSEAFEEKFGIHLKSWKGETTLFKEAEIIVNKYFPIDLEEQVIRGVRAKLIGFRERLETLMEPSKIISLMREITDFLSRHRAIVNKYYIDYYLEIIRTAEEKISPA
ncbi:MAG: hypothetical protein ACFE8B_16170 [Candidatus Hermodarchaeota archaeon]